MYDTIQELLREIQAGEDSFLDFKEVVVRGRQISFGPGEQALPALAKSLTCFANADGGVLLFGVADDGAVVGYDPAVSEQLQNLLATAAREHCEPPLDDLLIFDQMMLPNAEDGGVRVLKAEIRRSSVGVHAPKGRRPYRRVGARCVEMTMDQQARLLARRGVSRPFEEHPVRDADDSYVDVSAFIDYLDRRFGEDDDRDPSSVQQLLLNQKIIVEDEGGVIHPSVLGLLLFSRRPTTFLGGAWLDLVVYNDVVADADHQRDAKRFEGPVPQQIEHTISYLAASPYLPTVARKDHQGREDFPAYSLRALQEAIVNALVHRDYALAGSQVRVFVFTDRIEISSPGGLHNSLIPEDLFAGAQPYRRNQLLAGFMRDFTSPITGRAYMESRGEGFLMMVRETERLAGRPPTVEQIGDSVRITIPSAQPIVTESL